MITFILFMSIMSIVLMVFFAGYCMAITNEKNYNINLMQEGESLEPIFARLDREYAYTGRLDKPFTDEN